MDMNTIYTMLSDPRVLAVVTPVLVAGLKQVVSGLPSWAHPLLSVIFGAALSAVSGGDPSVGAVGGAMGVGLREIIDQGKKAVTAPKAPAPPTA